ncbi:MAG: DUF721 domain-containing protein [Armatimonadetes bacterium]|nr:DUF721 domain-containing protein [Armatimonadota bacterium]MDW8028977.1 DUF721 domain-containing protein [Armatimonadota bacterium]
MEPVRDILEKIIGQLASPEWLKNVLKVKWRQIVGDQLAKRTQVYQVKNGVVTVIANSPAIASELQYRKDDLKRRIKETAYFEPSDIRIRIGVVKSEESVRAQRIEQELSRLVLSPREHALIEQTVAPIQDPLLREKVAKVFEQFLRLNQWKRKHGFKECPRCKALYRGPRLYCPVCQIELRKRIVRN